MKIIHSAGGPIAGIPSKYLINWKGVQGKGFVEVNSYWESDYEAACSFKRKAIGILHGQYCDVIFILMPFETAIKTFDSDQIYIIQVENADEDWMFDKINYYDIVNLFDQISPIGEFNSIGGDYIFFDAAYEAAHVGDDYISIILEKRKYSVFFTIYKPDDRTVINICKLK